MKLIKLEDYQYVIISDDEIKIDDIVLETYVDGSKGLEHIQTINDIHPLLHKKVTHTSIPIEGLSFIDKYEVKELLGEVDVEKKSYAFIKEIGGSQEQRLAYIDGYREALEDNKDRKYTEKDVIAIVEKSRATGLTAEYILQYLQSPTSWDVEFVDGKLKLI